jgi:hypothetical protein
MAKKVKKKKKSSSSVKKARETNRVRKPKKAAKQKAHRPSLATTSSGPPGDPVVMEFTKSDDSPDDVRITLFNPTVRALEQGSKTGRSDPRQVGDRVRTLVNVMVNQPTGGSRTATITVTHASPPVLVVTVPQGQSGVDGVTTLDVV